MGKINIFWFRRDLRLNDNAALYHALKSDIPILPIFIFDSNILDQLPQEDARVSFIHKTLKEINQYLHNLGSTLDCRYGDPIQVWKKIVEEYDVSSVYTNRDYEPYAKERDQNVSQFLLQKEIEFEDYKDHVIFNKDEVVKDNGTPYLVFTPYSRKWYEKLNSRGEDEKSYYLKSYPTLKHESNFHKVNAKDLPTLNEMGFRASDQDIPKKEVKQSVIKNYGEKRNFPSINGTSKLGIHYRFGTISIREKARKALSLSKTYVNELIWRDFYSMILDFHPHVVKGSFRPKYDKIEWLNNEDDFERWKSGQTGYPIVDAGMRELNQTGYMHNRVRMIVASFLTKHLLIDWRWGEAYFAEKLLDFDLASNNGGWQWASGSGTDAAPYFRIFNPESQMKKFDKQLEYVKKWVPEFGTENYVSPIIDHKEARARCLETYKTGLNN